MLKLDLYLILLCIKNQAYIFPCILDDLGKELGAVPVFEEHQLLCCPHSHVIAVSVPAAGASWKTVFPVSLLLYSQVICSECSVSLVHSFYVIRVGGKISSVCHCCSVWWKLSVSLEIMSSILRIYFGLYCHNLASQFIYALWFSLYVSI